MKRAELLRKKIDFINANEDMVYEIYNKRQRGEWPDYKKLAVKLRDELQYSESTSDFDIVNAVLRVAENLLNKKAT